MIDKQGSSLIHNQVLLCDHMRGQTTSTWSIWIKKILESECGWIGFDSLLSLTLRLKDSNVDFNELIALYHNVDLQYCFLGLILLYYEHCG